MEPTIISAIQKGLFQQVRFLVEFGLDVNERDVEGRSPLSALAFIDDQPWGVGLAHLLLEKGASIGLRDKRGLNAMHYACIYERPELVKVYLGAIDYNLNQGDKQGNTALHLAVTTGNLTITRLLLNTLQRYKMSADRANKAGVTPLIQAWKAGQMECALLLKQQGSPDLDHRDLVEGRSALEWEQAVMADMERERTRGTRGRPASATSPLRPRTAATQRPRTAIGAHHHSASNQHLSESSSTSTESSTMSLDSAAHSEAKPIPNYMRPRTATRRERQPVAPLLSKRRRSFPNDQSNWGKENVNQEILTRDKLCKSTIRNAEENLRNKPEYVFQVSPLEYFHQEAKISTPGATRHVHFSNRKQTSVMPGDWRGEMKSMYKAFEFQFTESFRKTAKQPEPERSSSPSPSECVSEAVSSSDRASQYSRQRQRRTSVMKTAQKAEADRQRKSSVKDRRKNSQLNPGPASLKAMDSSSTESINSSQKHKVEKSRRISSNTSLDHHDDLSDISSVSHTERPGRVRAEQAAGRPVQKATLHGPIPVVKEPKGMKAIRE